jgi:hypothetical protein
MNAKVISEGWVVHDGTRGAYFYNRQSGFVVGNPTIYASRGAAIKVAAKQTGDVKKAVVVIVDDTYVEPMGS